MTEDKKEVYCTDVTVTLPADNTYCVVELTTTIDPSHFYVKFPFGTNSIQELIDAAASGEPTFFFLWSADIMTARSAKLIIFLFILFAVLLLSI